MKTPPSHTGTRFTVLGGGVAGLSTGVHLIRNGVDDFRVFEGQEAAGGLARSFHWHGVDCDLGPHRLYTDDEQVLKELLSLTGFRLCKRKSRIYLSGKWIRDPVSITDLIRLLPLSVTCELIRCRLLSAFRKNPSERSFSSYVINHYGEGLHRVFFKPYVEKLFGIPADQVSVKWARDKIRVSGLKDLLFRKSKLYFKEFHYPERGGYGAIAGALEHQVSGHLNTGHRLIRLSYDPDRKRYLSTFETDDGERRVESEYVISSLPLPVLCGLLGHSCTLTYQSSCLVYLWVDRKQVMDDHWVYVIDEAYDINRISEFRNFSEPTGMERTVLCVEVTRTNEFPEESIIRQLESLGLLSASEVLDTKLIRIPHAYPVYDLDYTQKIQDAREFLDSYPKLLLCGRQGEFRHQDVDDLYAATQQQIQELIRSLAEEGEA